LFIHESSLLIPDTIPSRQVRLIRKEDSITIDIPSDATWEAQIKDYVILDTSGAMDFK